MVNHVFWKVAWNTEGWIGKECEDPDKNTACERFGNVEKVKTHLRKKYKTSKGCYDGIPGDKYEDWEGCGCENSIFSKFCGGFMLGRGGGPDLINNKSLIFMVSTNTPKEVSPAEYYYVGILLFEKFNDDENCSFKIDKICSVKLQPTIAGFEFNHVPVDNWGSGSFRYFRPEGRRKFNSLEKVLGYIKSEHEKNGEIEIADKIQKLIDKVKDGGMSYLKPVLANIAWVPRWDHEPTQEEMDSLREFSEIDFIKKGGIPHEKITFDPSFVKNGYQYGYAFPQQPIEKSNILTFFWSKSSKGSKIVGVYGLTEIGDFGYVDKRDCYKTIRCPIKLCVCFKNFIDHNSQRHGNSPRQATFSKINDEQVRNIISDARDANQDDQNTLEVLNRIERLMEKNGGNEVLEKCIELLDTKRQIILCGPPGTSKTYLADKVAKKFGDILVQKKLQKAWWIPAKDVEWNWINNLFPSTKDPKKEMKPDSINGIVKLKDIGFDTKSKKFEEIKQGDVIFAYQPGKEWKSVVGIGSISQESVAENSPELKIDIYFIPSRKWLGFGKIESDALLSKSELARTPDEIHVVSSIEARRISQLIVQDAPEAEYYLKALLYSEQRPYHLIQFHPSYTYEDFVRGLVAVPRSPEEGGGVTFESQDKIFAKMCQQAAGFPDKKFVLIIDEINRADMAKVFGELIYGLEYRGEPVDTPYEVEGSSKLVIPKNLYIIGTMNTADKSIALLDYAIRRRFAFVPMYPDRNIIETYYDDEYSDTKIAALNLYDRVKACFDAGKGRDLQVGHTYFMVGEKKKLENGGESKEIYELYESEKPDAEPIDDNRAMELLKQKFIYETAPIIHEYVQAGEDGLEKKKIEEIEAAYKSDDIVIELAELFGNWSSGKSESVEEKTIDTDDNKDNNS